MSYSKHVDQILNEIFDFERYVETQKLVHKIHNYWLNKNNIYIFKNADFILQPLLITIMFVAFWNWLHKLKLLIHLKKNHKFNNFTLDKHAWIIT